jgi:tetratricopeptide (TPR) repeat protein
MAFLLCSAQVRMLGAEAVQSGRSEETNTQEALRAYLQLQEQLHANQLALEQTRKEAKEAAVQNADVLAKRLQEIEAALSTQRSRELDAMQSSNRVMLLVAGVFAAIGFMSMLIMAYFQWRTVNGLAEISAALPMSRGFGPGHALAALGPGDLHLAPAGPTEQSNLRLLGAMEQLEKRIHELEHTPHQGAKPKAEGVSPAGNGDSVYASQPGTATGSDVSGAREESRISVLLGKGQSMLNLDQAEAALTCFNEILSLAPNHGEALVKKGLALEQLQKLNEAIECYDRAIAADGSLTIAYLHKGGLCNRLERFNEALDCYEKALRAQETARGRGTAQD